LLDNYIIICSGIKASLNNGDIEQVNYFLEKLEAYKISHPEYENVIVIINKLLKGEFSNLNEDLVMNITDDSNLELILTLLKLHAEVKISSDIFDRIFNRYADNLYVLREYALFKHAKGDTHSAEVLFRKAVNKNIHDAAIYFYLISILLKQNRLEELPEILTLVVDRFGDNPNVLSKLNILQEKIAKHQCRYKLMMVFKAKNRKKSFP
jgi:tetratricopeptide (TPR) repeat protein